MALLFQKHAPLVNALSFVQEDLARKAVSTIPRGGGGRPLWSDSPRHSLRSRSGLPPPTNPLAPIYKVRQESNRVVYSFDLPKDVKATDLDIHVNHERKVLQVKGRRGRLITSSRATTQLNQEIPLDDSLVNLHSGRVQFSSGNVSIGFSKCTKMEKLDIKTQ